MADDESGSQSSSTVSAVVAARLIMVTPQRLRQLVKEGFIPEPKARDAYSLVGVVQGYIAFLKDEGRRTSKSAANSRVSDARAAEIEMRIEERSRALVDEAIREALGVIDEYGGPLRSDLQAMVPRVTNDLALRRRMETEINGAFGAAAKRIAAAATSAEASGTPVGGSAPAKPRRMGKEKPGLSPKRGRPRTT